MVHMQDELIFELVQLSLLFRLLAGGDIFGDCEEVEGPSRLVAHERHGQVDPDQHAVFSPETQFPGVRLLLTRDQTLRIGKGGGEIVRHQYCVERLNK